MKVTKYIFLLACLGFFSVLASAQSQQQQVTDDKGRTMDIYIPIVEEVVDAENQRNNKQFYEQEGYSYFDGYEVEFEPEQEVLTRQIKRLSASMPLIYNEEVKRYIDRYVTVGRKSTSYLLARAQYYNHFFEEALRAYGLPMELKHLPVVESGLNPNAVSRVGAAGLWQFMPTTGREYDLVINSFVDERRDPIKSSYAAAKFLSTLYRRFGDWNLALAAYNCGPNRVSAAIEKAGGVSDFWAISRFLPKETRGYVPAFIAANYVMNYSGDYNILPESTGLPSKPGRVKVSKDLSFTEIATLLNLDIDLLKLLNPQFRQGIIKTINGDATLLIPSELVERFNRTAYRLYESRSLEGQMSTSTGETENQQILTLN